MFTLSLQPAARQICGTNHGLLPLAYAAIKHATQNPTHSTQHSLFSKADKKDHSGAIVAAPSFDAELHIETTTIMFADVVESVRLIEQDELGGIKRIRALFGTLSTEVVPLHQGKIHERRGDGLLITFPDAKRAAACAQEMHRACNGQAESRCGGEPIRLRIGLHCADVFVNVTELYGHGVNVAARIANVGQPCETTISAPVRDQLTHGVDGDIEDLGDCDLKHASAPVRLYRVWSNTNHDLRTSAENLSSTERPTIAILPFAASALYGEQAAVGELLADSLTVTLSRTNLLRVISRLSTLALKGGLAAANSRQATGTLRCAYVLTGRYVLSGQRLIVFVELSETQSGTIVWADQLIGSVDELLRPDSELLGRIATETQIRVIEQEIALARVRPLPSLRSYTLYLGGLALMHRQSLTDFDAGRRLFEHLVERHPTSAIPRAWLGKWYMLRVAQGWSTDTVKDGGRAATNALHALQFEPENSLCLVVKGVIDAYLEKNFESAEACYVKALQHNPNDALAHLQMAALYGWQGRGDEAIAAANESLALSPLDPHLYFSHCLVAAAHLGAGDYAAAINYAQQSLRANRMHVPTYKVIAMAQAMQGSLTEANQSISRLRQLSPEFTISSFESASPWRMHPRFIDIRNALSQAGLATN